MKPNRPPPSSRDPPLRRYWNHRPSAASRSAGQGDGLHQRGRGHLRQVGRRRHPSARRHCCCQDSRYEVATFALMSRARGVGNTNEQANTAAPVVTQRGRRRLIWGFGQGTMLKATETRKYICRYSADALVLAGRRQSVHSTVPLAATSVTAMHQDRTQGAPGGSACCAPANRRRRSPAPPSPAQPRSRSPPPPAALKAPRRRGPRTPPAVPLATAAAPPAPLPVFLMSSLTKMECMCSNHRRLRCTPLRTCMQPHHNPEVQKNARRAAPAGMRSGCRTRRLR